MPEGGGTGTTSAVDSRGLIAGAATATACADDGVDCSGNKYKGVTCDCAVVACARSGLCCCCTAESQNSSSPSSTLAKSALCWRADAVNTAPVDPPLPLLDLLDLLLLLLSRWRRRDRCLRGEWRG